MKTLFTIIFACLMAFTMSAMSEDSTKTDSVKMLKTVEVSTTRADNKTPVSQKTLYSNEIQKGYFGQDVPSLLTKTPSVIFYSDAGTQNGYSYMRLRGLDQTRINFSLNGICLSEPEDQGFYSSNFTDFATNISSVQIQRGVGTSQNGTSSFGGSVNFESPNLFDTTYSEIQIGYGSYSSNRMSAVFNTGMLKNGISIYGRYSSNFSEGYRYHSGTDAQTFFLSGGYFGEKNIIKFTAFSGKSKNQMAYLATSLDDINIDPRTNYLLSDEKDAFRQDFAQLQHIRSAGKKSYITSSLYYIGLSGNYDIYFAPDMLNFSLFSDMYGAMSNYSYYGEKLKLNVGIHANIYYRNHSMSIKPMVSQSFYSNRGDKDEVSAFVKVSYDINKFTLFGDVQGRISKFSYIADKNYNIVALPVTWKFINPKGGITYTVDREINFYASVGQMHREPTRNDMFAGFDDIDSSNVLFIGNLDRVKPESVVDFELGTNISLNKFDIQADVYRMDFANGILPIGTLSSLGLPLMKNISKSYRQGVEFDLSYSINKYLKISGNINYMIAKIEEYTTDYDSVTYYNVTPLLSPNWIVNTNIEYLYKNIFTIGMAGKYISSSYLNNTQNESLMLPATNTAMLANNLYVEFKIKNYSLTLNINNITNSKNYSCGYSIGNIPYYYVGATRNCFLSLKTIF